jgi:hypothetical protein
MPNWKLNNLMKMRIFTKTFSVVLVAALAVLFGCGGGGSETPKEKVQLGKLSKTWTMTSAELNGVDKTALFPGFKLVISGTFTKADPEGPYDYAVQGTVQDPSPWDKNGGEWSFVSISGNSGQLLRSDNLAMTYTLDNTGNLTISFECDEDAGNCDYAGGRVSSVLGPWIFEFSSSN